MIAGLPLSFAEPILLFGLLSLPLLWWLLRVMPPRPRRIEFPPTRLLFDIAPKEETPSRTPWWLTALRLAAAALIPERVAVCHADVPFLCDIQRAITLAPQAPYTEVPEFLAQQADLVPAALDTLRYVDCALLARRITARCLLSVGLMDAICPPSTVFAAYNEITAGKDISVHPFTDHAVPAIHVERQLRHFRDFLVGGPGSGK